MARFNVDGSKVEGRPVFPFDLEFEPNPDVAAMFPMEREIDENGNEVKFYDQLKRIPEGTVLFWVFARDVPEDEAVFGPSNFVHIANLRQTAPQITSDFGDRRLFFQHESMRMDFDLESQWRDYVPSLSQDDTWGNTPIPDYPEDDATAKAWLRGSLSDHGCPFAWLLSETFNPIFDQ